MMSINFLWININLSFFVKEINWFGSQYLFFPKRKIIRLDIVVMNSYLCRVATALREKEIWNFIRTDKGQI